MKNKNHPRIDLENFQLADSVENDPLPRGGAHKIKSIDPIEEAKLNRTRDFGGLVPERSPVLDHLCRTVGELPPVSFRLK